MALAGIEIFESTTGSETKAGLGTAAENPRADYGSTDFTGLNTALWPVPAAAPFASFQKYHFFTMTLNDSTSISNIRYFLQASTVATACSMVTSATDSAYTSPVFAAPVQATTGMAYLATTALPAENVEIGGVFGASLAGTTGESNYVLSGIMTTASATAGPTQDWTIRWTYDEIA